MTAGRQGNGSQVKLVICMEKEGEPNIPSFDMHSEVRHLTCAVFGELQDTDYGKTRMWGAVGWGGFSPVAGWIVTKYGIDTAFIVSLVTGALGTATAAALPVHELAKKQSALSATDENPGRPPNSSNPGQGEPEPEVQQSHQQDQPSAVTATPSTPADQGVVPKAKSVVERCHNSSSHSRSQPQGKSPIDPHHSLIEANDAGLDLHHHEANLRINGSTLTMPGEKSIKIHALEAGKGLNPPPLADDPVESAVSTARDPRQHSCGAVPGPVHISEGGPQSSLAINIPSAPAAGGDDVRWPASWPPMEAAVCGPTEHAEARSLGRIPSSFLHGVEEHIPISTVPELLVRCPPSWVPGDPRGRFWGPWDSLLDFAWVDPIFLVGPEATVWGTLGGIGSPFSPVGPDGTFCGILRGMGCGAFLPAGPDGSF